MRTFRIVLVVNSLVLVSEAASGEAVQGNLYEPACGREVVRAGWPWCFWTWARPQDSCDYTGYYVGGGAAGNRRREHCPAEGTWGWDYQGHMLPRIVRLGWTYPPRRQGGEGSYQPDGPRIAESVHESLHSTHERQ